MLSSGGPPSTEAALSLRRPPPNESWQWQEPAEKEEYPARREKEDQGAGRKRGEAVLKFLGRIVFFRLTRKPVPGRGPRDVQDRLLARSSSTGSRSDPASPGTVVSHPCNHHPRLLFIHHALPHHPHQHPLLRLRYPDQIQCVCRFGSPQNRSPRMSVAGPVSSLAYRLFSS